ETPLTLIQQLLPDILVKGSDYDPKDIVGGKEVIANGGKVVTVPLVEGFSSTKIINKLKDQA
ncbi:MAG TPA: D-glycero-beta-D-manno-heptose 1-phosphate adenylyltransferase, partial [Bacteroidales bacterium]|nr:D-glycero-beta-D-manno-heptose 1-phosphate adenylyltransferase [Bacteroidales bacterium]